MTTVATPPPGTPRRAALTGGFDHEFGAVVVRVAQTPAPYRARRALDDELDVLDDHQRILVAVEQLAVELTAEGQLDVADRLRALARSHA